MSEELRIVVTDSGGGAGGGGRTAPGPVGVGGGGTFVAPSVARAGALGNVITGIGQGVGMAAFNAVKSAAARVVTLPSRTISMLASQAQDLSGLSAPLAEAVATSNMNSFNLRARRANAIGGALASFEGTRSRISTAFGDIGTELMKILLAFFEVVKPLIESMAKRLESIDDVIRTELPKAIDRLVANMPGILSFLKDPLTVMSKALKAMQRAQEKNEQQGDFFDQLLGHLAADAGQPQRPNAPPRPIRAGDPRLGAGHPTRFWLGGF